MRVKYQPFQWVFLRLFFCLKDGRNISDSVLVVFLQIIFFGLLRRSGYLERKQANIAKSIHNKWESRPRHHCRLTLCKCDCWRNCSSAWAPTVWEGKIQISKCMILREVSYDDVHTYIHTYPFQSALVEMKIIAPSTSKAGREWFYGRQGKYPSSDQFLSTRRPIDQKISNSQQNEN